MIRSWSGMACGMTSLCITISGLLVIITSRSVADVVVTRVGVLMGCFVAAIEVTELHA